MMKKKGAIRWTEEACEERKGVKQGEGKEERNEEEAGSNNKMDRGSM